MAFRWCRIVQNKQTVCRRLTLTVVCFILGTAVLAPCGSDASSSGIPSIIRQQLSENVQSFKASSTEAPLSWSNEVDDHASQSHRYLKHDDPKFWEGFFAVLFVLALPGLLFITLAATDIILNRGIRPHVPNLPLPSHKGEDFVELKVASGTSNTPCSAEWQPDGKPRERWVRLFWDVVSFAAYAELVLVIMLADVLKPMAGPEGLSLFTCMVAAVALGFPLCQLGLMRSACQRGASRLLTGEWRRASTSAAAEYVQQLLDASSVTLQWKLAGRVWMRSRNQDPGQAAHGRDVEEEHELELEGLSDVTGMPQFPIEAVPYFTRIRATVDVQPVDQRSEGALLRLKRQQQQQLRERATPEAVPSGGWICEETSMSSSVSIKGQVAHELMVCPGEGSSTLRGFLLSPWVCRASYFMFFGAAYHWWLDRASPVLAVEVTKAFDAQGAGERAA